MNITWTEEQTQASVKKQKKALYILLPFIAALFISLNISLNPNSFVLLLFALLHSIKAITAYQKSSQIYQSIKTKKSQQTTVLIGLTAGVVIIR